MVKLLHVYTFSSTNEFLCYHLQFNFLFILGISHALCDPRNLSL